MSYQPVQIPFFSGQDESYDKKLLPAGPMRKVENSVMERTGRLVERRNLRTRVPGQDNGSARVTGLYRNDLASVIAESGERRIVRWRARDDGTDLAETLDGLDGGIGYAGETRFAVTSGQQISPSVAQSSEGMVHAWVEVEGSILAPGITVGNLMVRWTVPGTGEVLRTLSDVKVSGTIRQAIEVKVVCHPDSSLVILVCRGTDGYLNRIFFDGIDDNEPTQTFAGFPNGELRSSIDAVICTKTSYVVSYTTGSNFVVERFGFDKNDTSLESVSAAFTTDTVAFTSVASTPVTGDLCGAATTVGRSDVLVIGASDGTPFTWNVSYPTTPVLVGAPLVTYDRLNATDKIILAAPWTDNQTGIANTVAWYTQIWTETVNSGMQIPGQCVAHPYIQRNPTTGKRYVYTVQTNNYAADFTDGAWEATKLQVIDGIQAAVLMGLGGLEGGDDNWCFGGMALRAGAVNKWRSTEMAPSASSQWTPHRIVDWEYDNYVGRLWPTEQGFGRNGGEVASTFSANVEGNAERTWSAVWVGFSEDVGLLNSGEMGNARHDVLAGAGPLIVDSARTFLGGFGGPPQILNATRVSNPGDGPLGPGVFQFRAILEYQDSAGRYWQSAISNTVSHDMDTSGNFYFRSFIVLPPGYPEGSKLVLYRTLADQTTFYRLMEVLADGYVMELRNPITDAQLVAAGIPLYTDGGVLENSPPPAARYYTQTRSRAWAGGLDDPRRLQASKFLRTTEGVHWNNSDAFFVDIPDDCTGLAAMDDVLVAFTRNGVYLVNGDGPDDRGLGGGFLSPTRVPTTFGCINAASIKTTALGVFFQSKRGIELLNRGLSTPAWVGEQVRDITEAYPYVLAAEVVRGQSDRLHILVSTRGDYNPAGSRDSKVLVYDLRNGQWYVHEYEGLAMLWMGSGQRVPGPVAGQDQPAPVEYLTAQRYAPLLYVESDIINETYSRDDQPVQVWETGALRPAGMLTGAYGRRLNLLGTYKGPCSVTIEMRYDDADWHPQHVKTWTLTAADYALDDSVTFELTLPRQKFESIAFRVTVKREDGSVEGGFEGNGITVYFDTEGAGPRVGKRSKG